MFLMDFWCRRRRPLRLRHRVTVRGTVLFRRGVDDESGFTLEFGCFGFTRVVRGTTDKLFFQVFRAENGYFDKHKFTLYRVRLGVIQDSPYRDLYNRHTDAHNGSFYYIEASLLKMQINVRDLRVAVWPVLQHRPVHSRRYTYERDLGFRYDRRQGSRY